ncbi:MAG: HEAT repeat domain-containing protein [Pseudomonadota bacterium]
MGTPIPSSTTQRAVKRPTLSPHNHKHSKKRKHPATKKSTVLPSKKFRTKSNYSKKQPENAPARERPFSKPIRTLNKRWERPLTFDIDTPILRRIKNRGSKLFQYPTSYPTTPREVNLYTQRRAKIEIGVLIVKLQSNKSKLQIAAAKELKILANSLSFASLTIPYLNELLDSNNNKVKLEVIRALAAFKTEASIAIPKLVKIVNNNGNGSDIRAAAATALGKMKASNAIQVLLKASYEANILVRKASKLAITRGLGALAFDELMRVYDTASSNTDEYSRTIELLVEICIDPKNSKQIHLPMIQKFTTKLSNDLSDKDFSKRLAAIKALGKLGKHAFITIPNLLILLKDKDSKIVLLAINALGRIAAGATLRGVVEAITDHLHDRKSSEIRAAAALALGRIGKASIRALPDLRIIVRTDINKNVRHNTAWAIGEMGKAAKAAVDDLLIGLVSHNNGEAAIALAKVDPNNEKSHTAITKALQNLTDVQLRLDAANALGIINHHSPQSLYPLMVALNDKSPKVRIAAANAIDKLGFLAEPAVKELLKIIATKVKKGYIIINSPLAATAARALGSICTKDKRFKLAIIILKLATKMRFTKVGYAAQLSLNKIFRASIKIELPKYFQDYKIHNESMRTAFPTMSHNKMFAHSVWGYNDSEPIHVVPPSLIPSRGEISRGLNQWRVAFKSFIQSRNPNQTIHHFLDLYTASLKTNSFQYYNSITQKAKKELGERLLDLKNLEKLRDHEYRRSIGPGALADLMPTLNNLPPLVNFKTELRKLKKKIILLRMTIRTAHIRRGVAIEAAKKMVFIAGHELLSHKTNKAIAFNLMADIITKQAAPTESRKLYDQAVKFAAQTPNKALAVWARLQSLSNEIKTATPIEAGKLCKCVFALRDLLTTLHRLTSAKNGKQLKKEFAYFKHVEALTEALGIKTARDISYDVKRLRLRLLNPLRIVKLISEAGIDKPEDLNTFASRIPTIPGMIRKLQSYGLTELTLDKKLDNQRAEAKLIATLKKKLYITMSLVSKMKPLGINSPRDVKPIQKKILKSIHIVILMNMLGIKDPKDIGNLTPAFLKSAQILARGLAFDTHRIYLGARSIKKITKLKIYGELHNIMHRQRKEILDIVIARENRDIPGSVKSSGNKTLRISKLNAFLYLDNSLRFANSAGTLAQIARSFGDKKGAVSTIEKIVTDIKNLENALIHNNEKKAGGIVFERLALANWQARWSGYFFGLDLPSTALNGLSTDVTTANKYLNSHTVQGKLRELRKIAPWFVNRGSDRLLSLNLKVDGETFARYTKIIRERSDRTLSAYTISDSTWRELGVPTLGTMVCAGTAMALAETIIVPIVAGTMCGALGVGGNYVYNTRFAAAKQYQEALTTGITKYSKAEASRRWGAYKLYAGLNIFSSFFFAPVSGVMGRSIASLALRGTVGLGKTAIALVKPSTYIAAGEALRGGSFSIAASNIGKLTWHYAKQDSFAWALGATTMLYPFDKLVLSKNGEVGAIGHLGKAAFLTLATIKGFKATWSTNAFNKLNVPGLIGYSERVAQTSVLGFNWRMGMINFGAILPASDLYFVKYDYDTSSYKWVNHKSPIRANFETDESYQAAVAVHKNQYKFDTFLSKLGVGLMLGDWFVNEAWRNMPMFVEQLESIRWAKFRMVLGGGLLAADMMMNKGSVEGAAGGIGLTLFTNELASLIFRVHPGGSLVATMMKAGTEWLMQWQLGVDWKLPDPWKLFWSNGESMFMRLVCMFIMRGSHYMQEFPLGYRFNKLMTTAFRGAQLPAITSVGGTPHTHAGHTSKFLPKGATDQLIDPKTNKPVKMTVLQNGRAVNLNGKIELIYLHDNSKKILNLRDLRKKPSKHPTELALLEANGYRFDWRGRLVLRTNNAFRMAYQPKGPKTPIALESSGNKYFIRILGNRHPVRRAGEKIGIGQSKIEWHRKYEVNLEKLLKNPEKFQKELSILQQRGVIIDPAKGTIQFKNGINEASPWLDKVGHRVRQALIGKRAVKINDLKEMKPFNILAHELLNSKKNVTIDHKGVLHFTKMKILRLDKLLNSNNKTYTWRRNVLSENGITFSRGGVIFSKGGALYKVEPVQRGYVLLGRKRTANEIGNMKNGWWKNYLVKRLKARNIYLESSDNGKIWQFKKINFTKSAGELSRMSEGSEKTNLIKIFKDRKLHLKHDGKKDVWYFAKEKKDGTFERLHPSERFFIGGDIKILNTRPTLSSSEIGKYAIIQLANGKFLKQPIQGTVLPGPQQVGSFTLWTRNRSKPSLSWFGINLNALPVIVGSMGANFYIFRKGMGGDPQYQYLQRGSNYFYSQYGCDPLQWKIGYTGKLSQFGGRFVGALLGLAVNKMMPTYRNTIPGIINYYRKLESGPKPDSELRNILSDQWINAVSSWQYLSSGTLGALRLATGGRLGSWGYSVGDTDYFEPIALRAERRADICRTDILKAKTPERMNPTFTDSQACSLLPEKTRDGMRRMIFAYNGDRALYLRRYKTSVENRARTIKILLDEYFKKGYLANLQYRTIILKLVRWVELVNRYIKNAEITKLHKPYIRILKDPRIKKLLKLLPIKLNGDCLSNRNWEEYVDKVNHCRTKAQAKFFKSSCAVGNK